MTPRTVPVFGMSNDMAVDVLMRAKEKLAAGWCQHVVARNAQGAPEDLTALDTAASVCIDGAVAFACGGVNAQFQAVNALLWALLDYQRPAAWNDAPGRTQAEVLDLFDAAIRCTKEDTP